jgi:signal transduction histidine kinase
MAMVNKILLVDDEEGIRKVLGISLADSGYDVHTARNGAEALKLFHRIKPPIVLTDIKMPDMDGIALLKTIKGERPETEVIMLTGQDDMDLAVQSLKNDATDFVTKPIDDDVLDIALKRARERISMRHQIREHTENLERLVQEKTRQLLDAERMAAIGQTIAGLSHTIKNIAGGLRGGMFVLGQGIELDNRKYLLEGWDMIKGNVDKIRGLSLDLLNYGKYAEIKFQLCDPNRPAREAAALAQQRADEHGVALELDLDPQISPAWLDPDGVQRCLLNLVANAVDACIEKDPPPPGGRRVNLRTCQPDGWAVEYRVEDNGAGMPPGVREQIFQSFFSTKGTHGTGIGLMMTKKIVDQHAGDIEVQTDRAAGSTFALRLPVRTAPPAD